MTVLQTRGTLRERLSSRSHAGFRTIAIASWLGMLLIFALSNLVIERAGTTPAERNLVFGRLNREHSFGQTFVASPGNLVAVRVLLFANSNDREDPITLRLSYAEGNLPELAVVTLPLHALDQRTWSTFDIQPLALNLTTTLRLDIEA
jgi:hypothetical protein